MRQPLELRQAQQDQPVALACFLLGRLDKKKSAEKTWERSQMFPDVTENSRTVEALCTGNLSQVCGLYD